MILTITLNPTIDKNVSIEKLEPETKLRCSAVRNDPGGGGINVSKGLRKLGLDSIAIFPTGGHNGDLLKALLQEDDIEFEAIAVENETRESFIIIETSTNKQFRFNPPGSETEINVVEKIVEYIDSNQFTHITASGSLLPGMPADSFAIIARHAKAKGIKFILDSSGDALRKGLEEGVYLFKPNLGELAKLIGTERIELKDVENAARKLIAKGWAELIAVSMGKDGAMLVSAKEVHTSRAPDVEKKSTVGAGDSMVAGMVYMLSQNKPLSDVLSFGVACGTAATMNEGTELFNAEDAKVLFDQIRNK